MKVGFALPSASYNIVLDKEDLLELLEKGAITMHVNRTECQTSRAYWDKKENRMVFVDRKNVCNDLRFNLSEPVADIKSGDGSVQFLNINLDRTCDEIRKEK